MLNNVKRLKILLKCILGLKCEYEWSVVEEKGKYMEYREFLGSKTILHNATVVDMSHYMLSKSIEHTAIICKLQ